MMQRDVAMLLALANAHDQRQSIDDVKVQAWWSIFQQEARDMPVDFAREAINRHYALMTDMLMPAHIITSWRNYKARRRDRLAIPSGEGVPMPEWFKAQMRRIT